MYERKREKERQRDASWVYGAPSGISVSERRVISNVEARCHVKQYGCGTDGEMCVTRLPSSSVAVITKLTCSAKLNVLARSSAFCK